MWAASFYLDAIPTPPPAPVMGTHPNVEMKRQGSRPSRTHVWASDRSLEQPLCVLGIRGAALEPASHEKINPRGKSQSSCFQNKPRVQALIGWSLDVVAGVHLALLPVRRRERPCAESYTLALRISPASS